MVDFTNQFPHRRIGFSLLVSNILGLIGSIMVYWNKPDALAENLWGTVMILAFLYNYTGILLSRGYWIHAPTTDQQFYAPIKTIAIGYLLYSFLGFFAVQGLLKMQIIGYGGFNLMYILGGIMGIVILGFHKFTIPAKLGPFIAKWKPRGRRLLQIMVLFFLGFYCLIIFLRGADSQALITYVLSLLISMNVLTVAMWTFSISTLSVWLRPPTWPKSNNRILAIVCIGITVFSFLPTYRVLTTQDQANMKFAAAFGQNWNTFPATTQSLFLETPATVSGLIYGPDYVGRANNYVCVKDLIFHNETKYQLYYDVYYPKIPVPSIGNNATILFIVGGAYVGGKRDSSQTHLKYLASQGYIVFAIDYRVVDINKLAISDESGLPISGLPINPTYKTGNYTFRDMITDVGEFTRFLGDHPNLYGADYNRVYFYGESSGAHLASTVTYGWNSPWYAGNFSSALTLIGAVFYYPPIIASEMFYYSHPFYSADHQMIPGSPETNPEYFYATPSFLVNNQSVPCLIYHGTADEIVPIKHSDALKLQMDLNHRICIQVRFDAIGHGFTHDYQYQYFCLYYMERFLKLI